MVKVRRDKLKALVSDTLSAFNKAVQEKNFAKFHEQRLSPQFREELERQAYGHRLIPRGVSFA